MKTLIENSRYPVFDNYTILYQIASSCFGKIYRAKTSTKDKDVVIKIIESKYIWSKLIEKREKILSYSLNYVPKIFDILTLNGYNCIIEEFIDGECLDQIIPTNTLTFYDFFVIAKSLINTLMQLHAYDLIHGDIKPSNIIIKKDTLETYLIDIDSVFLHEYGPSKFFGTLLYAAPEQILENSVSTYSDIYSLGILLYNILENRIPFYTNKEGILDKVNDHIIFSLSNVNAVSFKDELQTLIKKMTHIEKSQRPKLDTVLREIEVLQIIAEKHNELNCILRRTESSIPPSNKDSDISTKDLTLLTSVAFNTGMFVEPLHNNTNNSIIKKDLISDKLLLNSGTHENYYRKQLMEEYAQINKQASISFWLWVSTFILGFCIIAIAVIMTVLGHYLEALTTVILEALVYFVQHIFAIREDYYRKQNSEKLKHLESGDYYDYIMEILDTTSDEFREKRIDTIIKSIQKQIEHSKEEA